MTKNEAISSLGMLKNCFAHQNHLQKKTIINRSFVILSSKVPILLTKRAELRGVVKRTRKLVI